MVKTNGAYPMPPYDPRLMPCCPQRTEDMHYIGRRSNEWLMNKVDAKAQEVYYNEDTNEYWMSIGYNRWEKWQGVGSTPTPTKDAEVYFGALDELPEDVSALENLTKETIATSAMAAGVAKTISADEQYVTIAFKSSIGTITSITEDGFEAISDFSNIITAGDYKFYCTTDEVYDPEAEINYVIKWGIN